jgi:hypothetical protein
MGFNSLEVVTCGCRWAQTSRKTKASVDFQILTIFLRDLSRAFDSADATIQDVGDTPFLLSSVISSSWSYQRFHMVVSGQLLPLACIRVTAGKHTEEIIYARYSNNTLPPNAPPQPRVGWGRGGGGACGVRGWGGAWGVGY